MIPNLLFFLVAALNGPMSPVTPELAAAPPSRTFLLRVCNKAEIQYGTLDLAIASLTPDVSHIRVTGWVLLRPSQCVDVGQFQKPGVFLRYERGRGRNERRCNSLMCEH